MKVVINKCYGGFSLSAKATKRLVELHSIHNIPNDIYLQNREDPDLIQVVEELGNEANGELAELAIIEIPDGIKYTIEEYRGKEHVAEVHRTWG